VRMAFRPLKSFFLTADELLLQDLPTLGRVLLTHLKSYEGLNTVWQQAGLNRGYFRAMLENRNVGLGPLPKEPEYGARQPEVTARMMEAWNWLQNQGLLIPNDQQVGDWFTISSKGQKLLRKIARFEHFEKLGFDRVKNDLVHTKGMMVVGGGLAVHDLAWEWVQMKEARAKLKRFAVGARVRVINPGVNGVVTQLDEEPSVMGEYWHKVETKLGEYTEPGCNLELVPVPIVEEAQATAPARKEARANGLTLISDTRIAELRALSSTQFDFRKLIRFCEEMNTTYSEGCYFATAMLTRGLLDHVPPLFGKSTFSEVANNYNGGGRSFKETMLHLENATRKVADAHLHMPIRKSETLPVAQQVNCAAQLDVLLSEIVRITH